MDTDALGEIRSRIKAAELARGFGGVELIAICKRQPPQRIGAVIAAGQRVFGESRVQEAARRWRQDTQWRGDADICLHLVGPLQTNKAEEAVRLFDVIHSVDRPKLAQALARARDKTGCEPRLFVQVNTGCESQKSGIAPDRVDAFIAELAGIYGFAPIGLMCLPPRDEDPALHFALLAEIARRNDLSSGLSMGMSGDFETAIACGATHVRIGELLFGKRQYLQGGVGGGDQQ